MLHIVIREGSQADLDTGWGYQRIRRARPGDQTRSMIEGAVTATGILKATFRSEYPNGIHSQFMLPVTCYDVIHVFRT